MVKVDFLLEVKLLSPVKPWYNIDSHSNDCDIVRIQFLVRDSILRALYAIVNPSVHPSVCLFITWVDQSKTVEVRIMQFSPYSSPNPLVFAG